MSPLFIHISGNSKETQCDCGTNLTSALFHQILGEQKISKQLSWAYFPQSQDCLDLFHQKLKTLLKERV